MFDGSAIVSIAGAFNVIGGGAQGTGTLHVRNSGTLNVSAAFIRGWDLVVDGSWVWGQNALSLLVHPTAAGDFPQVSIRNGGFLDIQHATAPLTLTGTGTTITNNGTILKSAGGVTSTISVVDVLNFTGITVNSGTLAITNGCTQSGPVSGNLTGPGCIN